MKLTPAQIELLRSAASRQLFRDAAPPYKYYDKRRRVTPNQRTGGVLIQAGLMRLGPRASLTFQMELTEAGRAALNAAGGAS